MHQTTSLRRCQKQTNLCMSVGRPTVPTSPNQGIEEDPRANASREGTPVLTVVNPEVASPADSPAEAGSGSLLIDEIVRDGARRMPAAAWRPSRRVSGSDPPR